MILAQVKNNFGQKTKRNIIKINGYYLYCLGWDILYKSDLSIYSNYTNAMTHLLNWNLKL